MYGEVSTKVAREMADPKVAAFFARLIQRVAPKSYAQAMGEFVVTRKFFENFGGDQVRDMSLVGTGSREQELAGTDKKPDASRPVRGASAGLHLV